MKRLFIAIIGLLILLVSCGNNSKFEEEAKTIREIGKDNYLNSFEFDNKKISIYMSSNSRRVYYLLEQESKYTMTVDDSFFSGKLIYEEPKKTGTTTTTNVGFVEPEDVVFEYLIDSNKLLIDSLEVETISDLDLEGFKNYCSSYYKDELIESSGIIYSLLQEVLNKGKIDVFAKMNHSDFGSVYLVMSEIKLSSMRNSYISTDEDVNSNYFDLIHSYLTEEEENIFMDNLVVYTATVFGGPGDLDVAFYVSEDMSTIYPYLTLANGDTYLFRAVYDYCLGNN